MPDDVEQLARNFPRTARNRRFCFLSAPRPTTNPQHRCGLIEREYQASAKHVLIYWGCAGIQFVFRRRTDIGFYLNVADGRPF